MSNLTFLPAPWDLAIPAFEDECEPLPALPHPSTLPACGVWRSPRRLFRSSFPLAAAIVGGLLVLVATNAE